MSEEKKAAPKKMVTPKKQIQIEDLTICDATAQMLTKARKDGVETAFDRAANMKACPIGADSAPMGHAFMLAARSKAVSTPSLRALVNI